MKAGKNLYRSLKAEEADYFVELIICKVILVASVA